MRFTKTSAIITYVSTVLFNFVIGRFVFPIAYSALNMGYRGFIVTQTITLLISAILAFLIYKIITQGNQLWKSINFFFLLHIFTVLSSAFYYFLIVIDVPYIINFVALVPEFALLVIYIYLLFLFIADKDMLPNIRICMVVLSIPAILFSPMIYRLISQLFFNSNTVNSTAFMSVNGVITFLFTIASVVAILYLINFFYSIEDEALPLVEEETTDIEDYDFNF